MSAGLPIILTALIVFGLVAAGDDTRPYLKAVVGRLVSLWSALRGSQQSSSKQYHSQSGETRSVSNFDCSVSQHNAAIVAATLGARMTNIALKPVDILTAASYDENGLKRTLTNIRYLGDPKAIEEMETVLDGASGHFWKRFKSDQFAAELTCGAFRKQQGHFRPLSLAEFSLKPILEMEHQVAAVLYKNSVDHATRDLGLAFDMENRQFRDEVAKLWDMQVYRAFNSSHPLELASGLRTVLEFPMCFLFVGYWNTGSRLHSLISIAASQFQANDIQKGATTLATLATGLYITSMIRQAMLRNASDDPTLVGARKQFMAGMAKLLPVYGQHLEPTVREAFLGIQANPDAGSKLWENLVKIFVSGGDTINATVAWAKGHDELEEVFDELLRIIGLGLSSLALPISTPADLAQRIWDGSLTPGLDPPITEKDFVATVQKME